MFVFYLLVYKYVKKKNKQTKKDMHFIKIIYYNFLKKFLVDVCNQDVHLIINAIFFLFFSQTVLIPFEMFRI